MVYGTDERTCHFAREEFEKYAKLVFTDWDEMQDKADIFVGVSKNGETILSDDDEIFIEVKGGKGKITGSNAGAVLIAVYRFFRECGCRFLRPGKDGEYIAQMALADTDISVKEKADSYYRCLIIEGGCSFENVFDAIDFCPKIGLNYYEFQFKTSNVFFERWYQHQGNPLRGPEDITDEDITKGAYDLMDEVAKRGMRLMTMGHGWTAYPIGLDANGWGVVKVENIEKIRPYLAQVNGKRELINGRPFLTNLCYSNPEVQDKIADYMIEYFRENPNVDIVDFAFSDNINVACECENCTPHRFTDIAVRLYNHLDERLTESGIDKKIVISVYIDTLWAPIEEKIKNPDRFIMGFYPISHVYHEPLPTEGIPDEEPFPYIHNKLARTADCVKNFSFLKAWQKVYKGKWILGEYHYMWDHYLDIGYQQIARVMWQDIKNLDKFGFCGMQMYQPQRCAVPTAMGFYTFGHTLWNKNTDFDKLSADYFSHAFGKEWKVAYEYLQGLSNRYDMKIKPGGRDYTALDCIPVLEECIKTVKDFRAKYDSKTDYESELVKMSWEDLKLHNNYVEGYLAGVLLGLRGDEEAGKKKIEEVCRWMWSIEEAVQPRWDIRLHAEHLPIWYDRLMDIKHTEEKGEQVSDFIGRRENTQGVQD